MLKHENEQAIINLALDLEETLARLEHTLFIFRRGLYADDINDIRNILNDIRDGGSDLIGLASCMIHKLTDD